MKYENNKRISARDVRAGDTPHIVRFVLGASLFGVILLLAAIVLSWQL